MSLNATVDAISKKMKTGMRSMTIEPALNNDGDHDGYSVTHNYHNYEHPKHGMIHHVKGHQLAVHIKKHLSGSSATSKGSRREGKYE